MKLSALNLGQACVRLNQAILNPQPVRSGEGVEREADLHDEIFSECRRRGWVALHGSMAAATHRTAGEPDFCVMADNGRVFFIECKSRVGKLSPAQLAMKAHMEKLGHKMHLVRSLAEFLEAVK